jgi:hypothetical protein
MKKGQRGTGTRPCSGSRVIVGASRTHTQFPRGVQRGKAPLCVFSSSPKNGGSKGVDDPYGGNAHRWQKAIEDVLVRVRYQMGAIGAS